MQFWDPVFGELGERIPLSVHSTQLPCVLSVVWSPDGHYIATGCDDGTHQVVDVLLRRYAATFRSQDDYRICSVSWSPEAKYLALGGNTSWGNNGNVRIWQLEVSGAGCPDEEALLSLVEASI